MKIIKPLKSLTVALAKSLLPIGAAGLLSASAWAFTHPAPTPAATPAAAPAAAQSTVLPKPAGLPNCGPDGTRICTPHGCYCT